MHVPTAALLLAAAAMATVRADGVFSADDQALWIDRFNYFRMTGLPWSAGNMRRMGWDAALATTAATTAAACSASTAAGVNVFSASTAANTSSLSLVDQAVDEWIVSTSLSTLATLDAPSESGDGVGTGVYNAYSQAVWAETYSVGCASATCSGSTTVVCQFSPAGNDGASAWYIHAEQGTDCPSGTTSSTGLCIVEGDAANDAIAPIPAGQEAYEVFPTYVSDMQTVLVDAARAVASGTTAPPATTTAAPTTTTAAPATTTKAPSATTKTPSATTKTPTTTTKAPSADSSASASTSTTATFDDVDGSASTGTVKASSASGSTFTNEASGSGTSTSATTSGSSTSTATAGSSTATTAESTTTASTTTTTTTTSGSGTSSATDSTAVSANNQSGDSSSGVSATGMAGVIVVGVAAVAGVAVFVSYRKNQQRQRDIMQNGGIHVL